MIFLIFLLYALFASLFGLSKDTLHYSEPIFLIGSRMVFAGLLLFFHQFFFNRKSFNFRMDHIFPLFLLGFLNIYLTNIAEIWGIKHMPSSKACLIYSLSPFLASIVAYHLLNETLNYKKCLGLIIGFMGLIPIFMIKSAAERATGSLAFISLAEISMLAAVLFSVYGWSLLKKVILEYNYTPLMANGISMLIGGSIALLHSYLTGENWNPIPVISVRPFLINSFIICLISNIICYNLYGYLLKYYSVTFMSFAGLSTGFFASFIGWYFLDETISWHYLVSISIFSIGLTIFYQEELKKDELMIYNENIIYDKTI